jgi:hypothetical protein
VQEIADWLDKLGLGCGLAMARIALGEPASASFAIRPCVPRLSQGQAWHVPHPGSPTSATATSDGRRSSEVLASDLDLLGPLTVCFTNV